MRNNCIISEREISILLIAFQKIKITHTRDFKTTSYSGTDKKK